jgi:hypothetical protein
MVDAKVRGEVVTVTVKLDAAFGSTFADAGSEQFAPVIARLHASVEVPPNPAPPIERVYDAVPPAETVAEPEAPAPMARPKPIPVPDSARVCGLPEALSLIDNVAFSAPMVAGLKLTLIVHVDPIATLDPQLLLCAKSLEVIEMPLMVRGALPILDNVMA